MMLCIVLVLIVLMYCVFLEKLQFFNCVSVLDFGPA